MKNIEVRLKNMLISLEELKQDFATLTDVCEADHSDDHTMNLLNETNCAIEDAIDCVNDMIELTK